MARRGRGAELNALRQKKKDEKTGSTTKKSQSSVSSNKNGGGRTGGLTKQQVQQKVSRSAGYTSSGKAKQPAQTQKANPYATTRNIINKSNNSNVPERASRTSNRINSSNTRGREQAPIDRRQTFATAVEMREARENERLKRNPAPTAKKMLEEREKNKDSKFAETVKNTGGASKKGFLDSVSGHAQSALDTIEAVEGNKHVTEHRARMHGVTDKDTISKMTEGAQGVSKLAREKRLEINEKQEKRQEEWDKKTKNSSGLQKAIYGAAESGTGMATDLAIGRLTGTGQAGALASMASRTYGSTRGQGLKEGATENEDRTYAALQALKEVGTELMFPGWGLAKGYAGKTGIKAGERFANALTKNLRGKAADATYAGLRMLGGTTEENLEELAGWGLDPFIKDIAYGRNVRARAKESLMSDLPEITSREQAEELTARLNSDSYINELAEEFKANGLGDKEAKELATKMRDFYAAYYAGDTDKVDEIGDDLAGDLTGVKKISKESFSTSELRETIESTTLLTATTGLPGTISTAQRGNQLKQSLKTDGLKALAKEALNSEDAETSERGKIAQAALESGKDITSTQAYDLEQGFYQQQERDVKRQTALIDTASKQAEQNGYVAPYTIDQYGRITSMEKATRTAYNEAAESASETLDHVDTKESLTDIDKAYGARAIAGFKTGAFTVDDANTIVADETIKDAFKAETGIDLKQYEVKNRDGSINIPKTNAATKDALFAMATDNLVKMAEAETANWKDVTKGETLRQVTARMGAKGGVAAQLVLNDVDERDTMQYRTMTAVSDYVYQSALNLGVSWEDAKDSITSQFSTIPEEKLRTLYDAGLADRQAANDKMLGLQTKVGEAMSKSAGRIDPTKGNLFIETEETPGSSATEVFRGIAESLGIDIYIVDDLPIKDSDRQANGQYVKGDIYINVNSTFEDNLGFIFMHEVTHHLKQYAPEQYKALENLVREEWFKANPEEMLDRIARKIKTYEDAGQTLTEEEALEEIIADSTHEFLMDKNFAEQVSKKDPSLAKAVLSAIKNLLRKLRQVFSSGNYASSKTQMDAIFGQLGIMEEAEKLWLDAYTEAAKNKAAVGLVEWQDKVFDDSRNSVGYHAGDLGKSTADDYAHQGYSRGTGHFGFGTYFVGDQAQIGQGSGYGSRPVETVDFDKYNLARPSTAENGFKLHNALKRIDGFVQDYSKFARHTEIDDRDAWDERYYITNQVNTDLEYITSDLYDGITPEPERLERVNNFVDSLPQDYKDAIEEQTEKYIERDNQRAGTIDDLGLVNERSSDEYWRYAAIADIAEEYGKEWESELGQFQNLVDDIRSALDRKVSRADIEEALKETERVIQGYEEDLNGRSRLDAEPGLDSAATVFMKALGFEGVDVRHLPGLDNTGYGSVIYDLKGEDLARKQEIGTARYSVSENTPIEDLDMHNATVEADDGDMVAEFHDNGSVRFSISSFDEKGREIYQKYLNKMVADGELSQKEADDMMREMETIYKISKEFADSGRFAPFTAWSYANVVKDDKGKPVFSAIKKNSEYKMNIDFSTICKKRRTLDAVFREMIRRGMFELPELDLNKDESAALVVNINNLIRDHGFEAACALCFVEARRYRQQQTAKTFTDMWNGLVESMYRDKDKIAYFNFGRDDEVKDVPDGIHTMDDSELDLSYIKKIANEKKDGKLKQTAEAKAARLILNNPEQRKLMRVGDMMASTGFENMHIENPELEKVYNSKKGTGGAKSSFGDVQYLNEIINSKTFDRQKAYDVSGVRIQSFSDYVPRMVFDYVQVIGDLAAKKLPAHAYTKEVLFALQFGLTGTKINLSLVPDVVADGIAPGLDADGNYIWNVEGTFPFDEAMKIQEAEGYKENCGTIAVGISDEQIMKMLADPKIQMVIPYHKSSLNPIVAAMTNVDRFTDYTNFQNTKDAEGKTVKKDFPWDKKLFALTHYTRGEKKGEMKPKDQWGDMQGLVKEYVEWCESKNYTPKFSQFLYQREGDKIDGEIIRDKEGNPVINPGYYKMLEDFALLDNEGNFKPQGDVKMNFPTDESAFGSMKSLIEQGLSEDTELEAKRSEEIGGIVDEIQKMMDEGVLTEQSATSEKLAAKFSISPEMDAEYMDAVNSGNMDEAQRLVDEAAKKAGYITKAYHGTPWGGFTEFNTDFVHAGRTFGDGIYLTSSPSVAKGFTFPNARDYSRIKAGEEPTPEVYSLYIGDLSNALEFDWKNFTHNGRKVTGINGKLAMIQMDIEAEPDRDVIIRNIRDGSEEMSDIYVVKNSASLKSSDPVTYAEDGSVVPLSERFDPNNDDIRYSLPTQDSDGNILTDGQMDYFKNSQARDSEGKMQVVYHTTNNGGFTVFDPSYSDDKRSLFFASNFAVSQTYGSGFGSNKRINLDINRVRFETFEDFEEEIRDRLRKAGAYDYGTNTSKRLGIQIRDKETGYVANELGRTAEERMRNWLSASKDNRPIEYVGFGGSQITRDASEYELSMDSLGWIPGFAGQRGKVKVDSYAELMDYLYDMQDDSGSGTNQRGYYSVYLNLENPLIVDANGANWSAITYNGEYQTAVNIAKEQIEEDTALGISDVNIEFDYDEDEGWPIGIYLEVHGQIKSNGKWMDVNITDNYSGDIVDDPVALSEQLENWAMGSLEGLGVSDDFIDSLFMDHQNVMSGGYDYHTNNLTGYEWFNKEREWIGEEGYLDEETLEAAGQIAPTYNTRELAEMAANNGNDGVIIRNCRDIGGASHLKGNNPMSDIFIAFSGEQVKDINNENPTENPDIRYSIPPEDETMNYAQTNADTTDNLWYTDPVMHEGAIRYSMSKKDFINGTTDKWNPAWKTEGRVLKEKSVETDIRNVIMGAMRDSSTNAKYRQKVVKETMLVARKAFDYMKSDEHTKAAALLYDHAHSIIENLEFFGNQDESEFQRYKELREYLRTTKITVPEDKRSDIDYEAFRRKNFRKILLGDGGTTPDKVWGHLNELWPEAFTEDIKEDIPSIMLQIENALDIYQPYAEAYSSEQCEEFAGDIANSLWDIIYEGEEYKSLADKYDDKAKAMKLRHQEAMRKVKENYKEKLTKQALEAKRKQYAMLDRQKERYEEKLDQQKARLNARQGKALGKQKARYEKEISRLKENRKNADAKRRARREHRTLYDRILKEYKDLTHRILNPSKDKTKNIPEQLRQPLAQMLYCFDLEKERSKKLEEMHMIPTRSQLNFRQLKDAMEQVVKEDPTAYEMSDIHKYLKDKMTDLADRVDGKSIDALDEADMQIVKDILSGLNKAIKEGQQLEIDGENYQKQVQCDKVGEGAAEHQKIYGKAKTYGGLRQIADNIVNMGELTPIYFFKQIPGMYDMYRQLRTGFDDYVRNENEIIDKIADILAPYYKANRKGQRVQGSEIEDWRHAESAETFDLISGDQTITLTIAQRMALYCLAKRSQAQGHMYSENGGIVASEITAGSKITKAKESVKGKIVEQKPVVLTPADVDNILASLTEDQMKIAEKLQDLMSKDMSVLGNRASMKLTGIEMYKEDNYFPIKVQGDSRPTDPDNVGIREKIRNPGFSNPLQDQDNAQNPIIVDDIFTVVASHCNEMNQYASYAVPITSFMKVYNGSVLDENGKAVKVKTLIRQTYGDKAITYIENFIDDINGNSFKRQGGLDDVLDKALGQAKKAAVFANLRVALQQPTAIVRAFAALDPKYFKGVRPSPKATQEMIEHCPIAQWKAWGYYDTHFGRDIEDVMMGKNVPNKMDYFMSEIYGTLDNMTWGMVWQAVKNEVKAKNKVIDENSQEFWDLCNERASYVFDTTQVVDSPFHRSNDMRSKNGLVKQLTSFQAEPTLSFNVLRQGLVDAIDAAKRGNRSKAGKVIIRTLTVWTVQALTVALAQSFVDALRRKGKKDGDDDEDQMLTWWQEIAKYFMRNFTDNFADDMNAINNIYFAKDIVPPILNAIKGEYVFGQQNLTFQWVDTLTNGIEQCRKKWEKGDAYSKSWYDCISELLGGIGYFAGVPAKTMMRGVKNAWHWFNKVTGANVFADDGSVVDSAVESVAEKFRGSRGDSDSGSESSGTKSDTKAASESAEDESESHEGPSGKYIPGYEAQAEKIAASVADKTGEEREKATWKKVSDYIKEQEGASVEELVSQGKLNVLEEYRDMYTGAGNTDAYFDERIVAACKKEFKKTINYDQTKGGEWRQTMMRHFMTEHGMTDADVSAMVYKSETAKDLKVAMRIGDEELIQESLAPLAAAGITQEDLDKLWDNRNRVDLKKYKDGGGRYADKLKSMGTFIWPTEGVITSHFGYRDVPTAGASSNHPAIDIGAATGTPVVASDGGVVIYAGNNGGYGNSVGIKHDNGMVTYYNHLYAWNVKVGDTVGQGQQIAQVGSTGISTGPHLDFKILDKNGKPVDPEKYLQAK